MYFDADSHVDECEDTWSYMPSRLRPKTLLLSPDETPEWFEDFDAKRGASKLDDYRRFWFLDGELRLRRIRSDERSGTIQAARELSDVHARLHHLDQLGIGIQVIYPTLLLNPVTVHVDLEIELCRSYNRWLSERCAQSAGRLRWVALPPFGSMPDALEEIRFAKQHGACGIFKRGIECDRSAGDPYFFPAYELAAALDMPVCIHASLPWQTPDPHFSRVLTPYADGFGAVTVLQAFHALAKEKVTARLPTLRVGFIEAGAAWLPSLLAKVQANYGATDPGRRELPRDWLEKAHFWVTCEASEDLAYLISLQGDAQLMCGTDYTHGDKASFLSVHEYLLARTDCDPQSIRRIVSENAHTFYGIEP